MGQRTNAISKDSLEKNVDRALTQNHPYLQKKVSIAAFSLTAIFLAYSAITAVQDLKTELSYFKADKHDDLEDIRKISTLSTQYGAVETAAAKYIIFDGFANKDAKIQREGFMILEKLRQKNPQNLNVLNEITLNAFLVNDYDKALAALTSMNQLNTSSTNIINGIGYAHYKKGDMGNALDHFQRALIINDSSPVTYFLIRDVFLKLGDKRMADKFDKKGALLKRKYGR